MLNADRLRQKMAEKGMSQTQLAKAVGVSPQAISHILSGQAWGSRHTAAIARAVGTTAAYLGLETDDPESHQPDSLYTPDEIEALDLLRALEPKFRDAAMTLIRGLATSAHSSTVHARQMGYQTQGSGKQLQAQAG